MEQEQDTENIPTQTTAEVQPTQEPIQSVGTFWERLDEVLNLVKTGGSVVNTKIDEILEQFPDNERINTAEYRSFIFQPDRISISSNDDVTLAKTSVTNLYVGGHAVGERFSTFRVNFKKPLRNVKSVQLLSAVIPNATQNIPDEQVCFFWYKLRTLENAFKGEWNGGTNYEPGDLVGYGGNNYACKQLNINIAPDSVNPNGANYWLQINLPISAARPNYYDLNPYHMDVVYLYPTFGNPQESEAAANVLSFNRTFQDYNDLVNSLNFCMTQTGILGNTTATTPSEITFNYDATTNKIQFVPDSTIMNEGYYFLPCGYADPNIETFLQLPGIVTFFGLNLPGVYASQTILNTRLGFTWDGKFSDPFSSSNTLNDTSFFNSLVWYLRPKDSASIQPWVQNILTANSYCDLVNTGSVRIYTDITLASTEDSASQSGLLSVVPVNASNLGVAFYQNNFNNPLTKIPRTIPQMGISMLTDNGLPYYLPNSATVLLELAITYH